MDLRVSLDALQAGARVRFVVHAQNEGESVLRLPRAAGDAVEVSVTRNDAELWRWRATLGAGTGRTTIPPGQSVRWFSEWADPVFGTFTAKASVSVDGREYTDEAPLTVTKRIAEAASHEESESGR